MSSPPPIVRVPELDMRRRFNDGHYWERVQSGEFTETILDDRHPAVTAAGEPHCTRSQMISYRDPDGNEVARVHQYLRTDGTLGASGRPDPKRVYEAGILYRLVKKSNSPKNTSEGSSNPPAEPPAGATGQSTP